MYTKIINYILALFFIISSTIAIANPSPIPLIQTTLIKLNQINYSANKEVASDIIQNDLLPLFDTDYITGEILAIIPWQTNKEMNNTIKNFIEKDLVNTLLTQLTTRRLTSFRITSVLPIEFGVLKIRIRISSNSVFAIYADLIIRDNEDDWKIVDILINNSSLLEYYKNMMRAKLNRNRINF